MSPAARGVRRATRQLLQLVGPTGQFERVRNVAGEGRELLRRVPERKRDELREVDVEIATFLVGRVLVETTHAALLERPDLLENPVLADELIQRCWRYLRRSPE